MTSQNGGNASAMKKEINAKSVKHPVASFFWGDAWIAGGP
jgi:hypothetical protein